MVPFDGDPPEGLFAYVTISGGALDEKHRRNPSYNYPESAPYSEVACEAVPDEAGSLELGVAVGPWKTLGVLELDKPQTFDGVTYRISRPDAFGDNQFLVHFLRTGVLANDDLLLPTAADGKVAETYAEPTLLFTHNLQRQRKETQPNYELALSKVVSYQLLQRKRQWVTFAGFATTPKTTPPTIVTPDDAAHAEELRKQAALDAFAAERKRWAAIPPDRTTTQGTLRAIIDATRAGDDTGLRKMLTATKPAVQEALDLVPRYFIAQEQAHEAMVAALGRDIPNEDLYTLSAGHGNLVVDTESGYFTGEWKPTADGAYEQDGMRLKKDAHGDYCLNLDALADTPSPLLMLKEMTSEQEKIRDALRPNTTSPSPNSKPSSTLPRPPRKNKSGLDP